MDLEQLGFVDTDTLCIIVKRIKGPRPPSTSLSFLAAYWT